MNTLRIFILYWLLLLAILVPAIANTQDVVWSLDTTRLSNPNFSMDRYHETLRYNDPLMYLTFPVVHPIADRKIPLEDGEGKDGFWLEGTLAYRFSIYKGKYYSIPALQRTRFTLDVALLSMLTRDESSPILPFNIKAGLGLDFLLSSLRSLKKEQGCISWTTLQFHHYSNGQADSFFVDAPVKRNNYRSGNFSTNYLRGLINIAVNKNNLLITSAGFQHEIDVGGALGSSTELKNYYGDDRILLQLNWIKKPKLITRQYKHRGENGRGIVERDVRRQLGARAEFEYIVGDLSEFEGDNKYRLGWHNYITYMPSVTNEVGFILHTYVGRHYLNMRFDDIVFAAGLGFYVKFNGR